jgi:hypothetical protein
MDKWSAIWLIILGVAALLFFGTALVISIVGTRDLRELLSKSKRGQ